MSVVPTHKLPAEQLTVSYHGSFAKASPAILLIHGWAASDAIWIDVLEELQQHFKVYSLELPGVGLNRALRCETIEMLLELFERDVLPLLPAKCALLGWSLGGIVAAQIAARFPGHIGAQVLISSNPQFVQSNNWQHGMSATVFKQFETGVRNETKRYTKRFNALQTLGAPTAKSDMNWLDSHARHIAAPSVESLLTGLQWLAQSQLHDLWLNPQVPTLYQYGAHDNIVPESLASHIRHHANQAVEVDVFADSAHLPFRSERERWLKSIRRFLQPHVLSKFMMQQSQKNGRDIFLNKKAVAHAFSKAAPDYDRRAAFQHKLGENLIDLVAQYLPQTQSSVLDLGAGTGYAQPTLIKRLRCKHIVALDLAQGMLNYSRIKNPETLHVLGDIESLPFAPDSFELVYSNLALQWCADYVEVFTDIGRCLGEHGYFAFTTLLPGSLHELQTASTSIGAGQHVNEFITSERIESAINSRHFEVQQWLVNTEQCFYQDPAELLDSVRGIGAGNHRSDRSKKLTRKRDYRAFIAALEKLRCGDRGIPLSYRVLNVVLKRIG